MKNNNLLRSGNFLHFSVLMILFSGVIIWLFITRYQGNWIKVVGTIFQLFGILMVLFGLAKRINLFGGTHICKSIRDYYMSILTKNRGYFKRFFDKTRKFVKSIFSKKIDVYGSLENTGQTVNAEMQHYIKPPEENITDVIRYLNEKFNLIEKQMVVSNNTIKKEVTDFEGKINYSNLSFAFGEFFGIVALILGLILSIIPEICQLFKIGLEY